MYDIKALYEAESVPDAIRLRLGRLMLLFCNFRRSILILWISLI